MQAVRNSSDKFELLTFPVAPLGCNCSILMCKSSREAIVVDPGGDAPRIIQLLEEQGARVRWIVHTHAHFDHILGTHEVAEHARQCAHAEQQDDAPAVDVRVALHEGDMFLYNALPAQCKMFGLPPQQAEEAINHRLNDDEGLEFGEGKLNVLHTPGHTPGSCCFELDGAGLVFSGDTLFRMGIGRTDLPGGDTEQIFKSIKDRLFTMDDGTAVIPGHGQFTRIFEEKKANPFF